MPDTDREIPVEPKPKRVKRDKAFYDCWKKAEKQMLDRSRGQKAAKQIEQLRAKQSLEEEEEEKGSQDEEYSPNEFDDSSIERYDRCRAAEAEKKQARLQKKFRESPAEEEARIEKEKEEYDELLRQQMIWKAEQDKGKPEDREPWTRSPKGKHTRRKGQPTKGKGKSKDKGKGSQPKGKGKGKKGGGKGKDRGLLQAVQQSLLDQCAADPNRSGSSANEWNLLASVEAPELSATDVAM